jgi:hypothetical protein
LDVLAKAQFSYDAANLVPEELTRDGTVHGQVGAMVNGGK